MLKTLQNRDGFGYLQKIGHNYIVTYDKSASEVLLAFVLCILILMSNCLLKNFMFHKRKESK